MYTNKHLFSLFRLERSLDRRVKAEVSQLESTIAKAEDPSGRLSVNLTQNLSKSLQVQISSEIAKSNAKFQQENTQMIHQMFNMLRGQMVSASMIIQHFYR